MDDQGKGGILEVAMENTFWTAFGASVLAATVTTIGIYVIRNTAFLH
jgi:hypothetical protein